MPLELWLAFTLASAVLLAIPGPTVMLVVSYAMAHGRQTGWSTVPGVALGDCTAMTISLLGAGAVLAASATLFTVLKLAGAAYLIWLGIQLWRADPSRAEVESMTPPAPTRAMFWHAYAVTALNPKSIVFFIAFVPQFVSPGRGLLVQFVILEVTFVTLAAVNVALWALAAGQLGRWFRSPDVLRLVHRAGGSLLIGAGVLTAVTRRTA